MVKPSVLCLTLLFSGCSEAPTSVVEAPKTVTMAEAIPQTPDPDSCETESACGNFFPRKVAVAVLTAMLNVLK